MAKRVSKESRVREGVMSHPPGPLRSMKERAFQATEAQAAVPALLHRLLFVSETCQLICVLEKIVWMDRVSHALELSRFLLLVVFALVSHGYYKTPNITQPMHQRFTAAFTFSPRDASLQVSRIYILP